MSTSNRAAKITKAHKVLKKHYKPLHVADRPLLEHLLYACCLQSATHEAADEAFAKLQQAYYDWNEVRVTTISELAEVMDCLPRPAETASRLKRTLQSVFEAHYSFDLEGLKKENIGKSVKQLERLTGVIAVRPGVRDPEWTQRPRHRGQRRSRWRSCASWASSPTTKPRQQKVPGLERAIAKSKGVEFGSLLHQLGADYAAAPFSPRVRAVLLEIAPDAKDRFPKRVGKKNGRRRRSPGGRPRNAPRHRRKPAPRKTHRRPRTPRRKSRPRRSCPSRTSAKKPPAEDKKKSHAKKLAEEETAVDRNGRCHVWRLPSDARRDLAPDGPRCRRAASATGRDSCPADRSGARCRSVGRSSGEWLASWACCWPAAPSPACAQLLEDPPQILVPGQPL